MKNKREAYLERIIYNFIEKYRSFKGITSVVISTAIQIDEATKSQIVGILKGQLKGNIELNEQVNEDIIGGFILTFENKQLDVSTSSELRKIKRELLNATLK